MPAVKKQAPKILSVDEIIDAQDLTEELVDMPEWGGAVKVRALPRRKAVELITKLGEGEITSPELAMLYVINGVIEPALTEDRAEQLNGKHPVAIKRIADRVATISGLAPDSEADALASFLADSE